jgi:hypothetical protein
MPRNEKGDSKEIPVTSEDDVRPLTGPVTDHTIASILEMQPTVSDLEVAVIFARGEGDEVDRLGHPLSGKAARIYEILAMDELYQPAEQ